MRAIFLILIVAVVALIAAIQIGLIDIRQTSPAVAPGVESNNGKLTTRAGQAPSFDVETGSIGVGAGQTKVAVPSIEIKRDGATVAVPRVEVRPPADANTVNTAR
ncbi:MAG: hypothetical protein LH465_00445 [Sphingomonas bacterium]|nr:hypothetical protein [Sphingomonas bacterium]